MLLDIIKEIAYHTDFETTLTLLDIYPRIYDKEFWKHKVSIQHPHKPYFDFWTGKENYLNTKEFIILTHHRYDYHHFIYEYDPFTLQVSTSTAYDEASSYDPIKIKPTKRYVLISNGKQICESDKVDDFSNKYSRIFKSHIADLKNFIPYYKIYGSFREPCEHHGTIEHLRRPTNYVYDG